MRWYFTFMQKQTKLKDKYVVFDGPYTEARRQMTENFGDKWGFQYSEEEWLEKDGRTQAERFGLTEIV